MNTTTHAHQGVLSSFVTNRSCILILSLLLAFNCFSQVVINEVVTDPQQDWSDGNFSDSAPGGSAGSDDEWIELYITANGLNLTNWTITVDDGTPFSGNLTETGAFDVVNYIGSGTIDNTQIGDYIILGNPDGSEEINNDGLTITLEDDAMTPNVIDQVIIDGSSGTMFTGNATGVTDESVCRIPNGLDTGDDAADFVLTRATLGTSNSPSGIVLINEVVTFPRQDWSGGGFTSTPGMGTVTQGTDEWIELYIGTSGLNLTRWTISADDGTPFSGDLTEDGAFQTVHYVGSGSFVNTQVGDYLVLGNPTGTAAMNDDIYIELFHPDGTLVDDVEIGSDPETDGTTDGAPDGSLSGGNSSGVADEAIARIANATDTDDDVADFHQTSATIGSENGIMNVFVDDDATDDNGLGTVGDPLQTIQAGVNLALSGGTVTVADGSYSESITISKSLTLNGANQGIAASGTRGSESMIDVVGAGIIATANNITIDGFQLGTNAADSDITNGIVVTGDDISVINNIVYANSLGISAGGTSSGTLDVSDNMVSMIAIEDATNPTNGSVGIYLNNVSGTADTNIMDNDVANAAVGITAYALTSSTEAVIDGGSITGCTTGILPTNADGSGGFSPNTVTLQNITMSAFATDADVGGTETGVYAFVTGSATASDDLIITMDNLDISGTGNTASNYSGIVIGDFPSSTDGISIDATINNCNIHDNENRGIYTRGADATTSITQSTITGNGFNPTASGGNPGFSVIARDGSVTTVSNCVITNPASLTGAEDIPGNYYTAGLHISTGGSLTVSDCSLDNNGNGTIAETSGINLSGNYFGTTDEATILARVGASNDFNPWLMSSTDTDGGTPGFQGDFSSLMVGLSGSQTGSSGRIEEGISLVDAGGTLAVNPGTYAESLTISKSLTLNGANQGLAGNDGGRSAESILNPSSSAVGITIGTSDITIDGFQFGIDNTTSNNTTAISNTGFSGFTAANNRIHANATGILINGISSGSVNLSDNYIEMLGLANPLATTSPSIGAAVVNISGTADVDLIDNDILTATYGVATFGLTSSTTSQITGGSFTGCTIGISSSNFDGSASFSASTLGITDVTMSGFSGPDGGLTGASDIPQAGVYAFTTQAAPSTDHDLTVTVDNADISGVGNGATDYSGILAADFFDTDPDLEVSDDKGVTLTVTNSNIHDNLNRGVHSRGADANVTVNTSTISNNTNAGGVVFAKGTLNINNSFIVLPATGATSGLLAQTDGTITASSSSLDLNGNVNGSTLLANIQDPSGDETINLSACWLSSTDESTILSVIDESDTDFSPWLGSDTDTDGATGFQPDLGDLHVGTSGSQSADFISEAHDLLADGGTITINADDYNETLTVTKNVSIDAGSGTTIDDIELNGGDLTVLNNTFIINNSLTMTSGVFDIDQDDGDKSDDPVFVLPGTVTGSSYGADTHFEGKIETSITGTTSFTFEVGDEGAYRPVILTPTNTTTFQVAHVSGSTPSGAGVNDPDITNLIGDSSTDPVGTIQSVMNFRYWDINTGGTPGLTEVAMQITAADNATDPSFLGATKFDGANWTEIERIGGTGTGPFVVTGRTSTFSQFSVYSTSSSANPLPVELIAFKGIKSGNDVQLSWITLTEINSDFFQVERMHLDEQVFRSVGKVNAAGNTNEQRAYHFTDRGIGNQSYYYRLKMVDFDNTFEYSNTILVTPDFQEDQLLLFPTPTKTHLQIKGIDPLLVDRILIFDLSGKLKLTSNEYIHAIDVSSIAQGHYAVRIELKSGYTYEGKLIKE
ncbi:T9SS type A sorting domain-containing protein [Ekhidna sp.]|uniref:T9SS type A sorting domain-containing protein n=1 Tax=Ekhidna sp. TaxID=2608089 RepID=UPI003CCBC799